MGLEKLTRKSLPYFQPWFATSGPNELPPDYSWMTNSCGGKAAIGVFGGGVMGLLMGVFLGAMSDAQPPVTVINGKDVPQAPLKEQVRVTMRATADKSMYWCRNFAFITGVFGGSECLVEKYRGKHVCCSVVYDVRNALLLLYVTYLYHSSTYSLQRMSGIVCLVVALRAPLSKPNKDHKLQQWAVADSPPFPLLLIALWVTTKLVDMYTG